MPLASPYDYDDGACTAHGHALPFLCACSSGFCTGGHSHAYSREILPGSADMQGRGL